MRKLYPREFRDEVVRVVRSGGSKTLLEQLAKDFGIYQTTLNSWMGRADVEVGVKVGMTEDQSVGVCELKRGNRLLEQEVEVLPRAAAYLWQANLLGK